MMPIMVSTAATGDGSPASHGVKDNKDDFAAHRAYQQLDEQSQILKTEAAEISRRLISIRQQLVTISDKMNTSTSTMTGAKVSEEDIVMAREAQAIMRRMGDIKGSLHAISKKKKQYHSLLSTSSSFNMNDAASAGSSSVGIASLDGFSESFFHKLQQKNPKEHSSGHERTRSVFPGAVSVGSTPCLASSSSLTDYPGGFLAAASSDPTSPKAPIQQQFLEMEEQRDGVPSPVRLQDSRKSNSSFPDNSKLLPWGTGIPGRVDHGIGVIGSRRRNKSALPSLEPIASFEISTDHSSNFVDDAHNISMSSQLSPITTDEVSSINAFDYPLVKPEAMNVVAAAVGTSATNHTASLFDDALMDTSSIEDPFEAVDGHLDNDDFHRGGARKSAKAMSDPNCAQETVMDLLFCQAMSSASLVLEKDSKQKKTKTSRGLCRQVLCQKDEGQEYSLETFLGPCQTKKAWI